MLFDQSIGGLERSRESQANGLRLRLNLDPSNPDLLRLYNLPWELIFWKERGEYLCLNPRTPLVRTFDVPRPARDLELKGDLHILVAMASPRGQALDLKRERRLLHAALGTVPGVHLHFIEHATPEALRRKLSDGPFQILHFMGHGSFDPGTGEGALVFENHQGDCVMLPGSALADLVRGVSSLRLAFLNACDTARTGPHQALNPFAGVAPSLVLAGLPAVVAMQFPISDGAAIAFSEAFYRVLAGGKSIETSTTEGRMAIHIRDSGSFEWATPVLFLRAASCMSNSTSSPSAALGRPASDHGRCEPQRDLLDRYRQWALERYRGMSLLGIGGGDLGQINFEQVYVPLRIARRPRSLEREGRGEALPPASDELGIEQIFSTLNASNPHVLLLGQPGAGKTTGLLKMLHQCLAQGPESLGLEAGTLAIFLRLRRLTFEDLDHSLHHFVQKELERELGEVAGGEVLSHLGARLWQHERLLLLCDGLDEIGDETLRVRACEFLDWELSRARPASLRAVISCRFAGYRNRVHLGESYSPLAVRPLDPKQSRELVRHWFREAQHGISNRLSAQEAIRAAEELVAAIESSSYGSQRWKVLVGSPLFLTLLCVIVKQGGHLPRHRVSMYDQCLQMLLGPWSHGRREGTAAAERDPPVDIDTALAVLRALAWRLHSSPTRAGLSVPEGVFLVRERLAQLGRQVSPFLVFDWLHREAGVLEEYATETYGFLHLDIQEYLSALEVASQGGERLDELCGHAGEEWWKEVFLLLVGLPGHATPLLERLLGSPSLLNHANLVRACLEEAAEPVIEPFLARLGPEGTPEQQAAILHLLRGWKDPRLPARVRALWESPHPEVAALARQVTEELIANPIVETSATHDVFVLHHPEDREAGIELARALSARGWQVAAAAEDSAWQAKLEQLLAGTRAVALPIAADARAPWKDRATYYCLRLFADAQCPLVAVRLPASSEEPEIPGHLPISAMVDLRGGWTLVGLEALDRALSGGISTRSEIAPVRFEVGQSFVEPITGCRLLWVSGGRFRMGGRRYLAEQPIHAVRVSPFWIGETPVTNRQFSTFLDQTGHAEPRHWRDRRFSSLEQPVVGVCWDDAQAFCQWLADSTRQQVTLPSEAQWEFSARGSDGREFPWGPEPPDSTRACYSLPFETGQPVPVDSHPAGKGPFGTLDQAGNVREWCLDVWSEKVYSQRASTGYDAVNPVVEEQGDQRVLRGGGWFDPPEYLRAAYRSWYRAKDRYGDFGFRIAVVP
jgi:formylglycine-generating enzyme required for sulfatase activity